MNPNKDQAVSMLRLVVLAVAFVVMLICFGIYIGRKSYVPVPPPAPSYQPYVTNAEVLHNWLPDNVYLYTIARIDDYLRVHSLATSTLTVAGGVNESNVPTYYFDVIAQPSGSKLTIGVDVSNETAVLATAVTINQQLQTPQVPSTQNNTPGATQYYGFDALVNIGLTATQSDEVQQALEKFSPSVGNITINTASISSGNTSSDGTSRPYTFSLSVDNHNYSATLDAIGLLEARLLLSDTHGRQVFDSGVISQGN